MNENYTERIESYLNGEMSNAEKPLFESELTTNKELSSLFKVYKVIEMEMNLQFNDKGREALKTTLGKLNDKYFPGAGSRQDTSDSVGKSASPETGSPVTGRLFKLHIWSKVAIAAVTLGFVSLGMIWYLKSDTTIENSRGRTAKTENEDLRKNDAKLPVKTTPESTAAAQDNEQRRNEPSDRTANGSDNDRSEVVISTEARENLLAGYYTRPDLQEREGPLQLAVEHMENDELEEAVPLLSGADEQATSRGNQVNAGLVSFYKYYYLGICLMELDSTTASINALNKAIHRSPNGGFRAEAEWYKALALIKANRINEADQLLQKLARLTNESIYKGKAIKLQRELSKLKTPS